MNCRDGWNGLVCFIHKDHQLSWQRLEPFFRVEDKLVGGSVKNWMGERVKRILRGCDHDVFHVEWFLVRSNNCLHILKERLSLSECFGDFGNIVPIKLLNESICDFPRRIVGFLTYFKDFEPNSIIKILSSSPQSGLPQTSNPSTTKTPILTYHFQLHHIPEDSLYWVDNGMHFR